MCLSYKTQNSQLLRRVTTNEYLPGLSPITSCVESPRTQCYPHVLQRRERDLVICLSVLCCEHQQPRESKFNHRFHVNDTLANEVWWRILSIFAHKHMLTSSISGTWQSNGKNGFLLRQGTQHCRNVSSKKVMPLSSTQNTPMIYSLPITKMSPSSTSSRRRYQSLSLNIIQALVTCTLRN